MELTAEQKNLVAQWVAMGLSMADIQKKLKEDCGLALTYMETRFLLDDLGLSPKNKPEAAKPAAAAAKIEEAKKEIAAVKKVLVELDRIARPGYIVSGSVTFSDGQKSEWFLDQYGQLGLKPAKKNYQPSQSDVAEFQRELQALLQKHGF